MAKHAKYTAREVAPVEPGALDEADAGRFLGFSAAWMRAVRMGDLNLMRAGKEPLGPAWVTIGKTLRYRPEDLRRWLEARAVVRGRVDFNKSRPAPAAACPRPSAHEPVGA
jgi:hypothetical protein